MRIPFSSSNGKTVAFKIAMVYAIIGGLWILFSDRLLVLLFDDPATLTRMQTLKGWFYVLVTAVIIFLLIWRSIVSVRQSEEALHENRRRLATLLANLPGMAYRFRNDEDWTTEFISEGCCRLLGCESARISSRKKDYQRLIHPEDKEEVWQSIERALQEREAYRIVYRVRDCRGDLKWVFEQGIGIYAEEGNLEAVEGFIGDITERKKVEEAFKVSEGRYRTLVESTSDAIMLVDRERKIQSFNRAFLDMLGYTAEEVLGQSVRILHPSEEKFQAFAAEFYPLVQQDRFVRTEWELARKDGSMVPIEVTLSAVDDETGKATGYVAIFRDISDRRRIEAELDRYRNHLEDKVRERTHDMEVAQRAMIQEEKLKILGSISSQIAHEIRNPLTSIGGFAKRLQKKNPESYEARIIVQESERLERILNRIENYLKPVEMRPHECSVNDLLNDVLALLDPELKQLSVLIKMDLAPDLGTAYVDPDLLCQIFINVLRNAVTALDAGTHLQIRTFESDQNVHTVFTMQVSKPRIKDLDALLLPFNEEGQSLGMAVSYRILRNMGGTFSLSRKGTEVSLSISLLKALQPQAGDWKDTHDRK